MMCFATAKGERFISGKLRRDEMRKNYCYYTPMATLHRTVRYPIEESS